MHSPAWGLAVALAFASGVARAEEPSGWVRFSEVMTELSEQPEFVEALLERLGRDPAAGGILGPENIKRFREIVLGKDFEALDQFPSMTIVGMGRAVRLADRALRENAETADAADPPGEKVGDSIAAVAGDFEEPLGIPTGGARPAPDTWLREVGFGLEAGDRVNEKLAPLYADGMRLAEVLNRLALNPDPAEPGRRYSVTTARGRAASPRELVSLLVAEGHDVEVADARYFANFGDLIYRKRDVLTPFWIDTGIEVPGAGRPLVVPASHSQHELRIRGPAVNAELSFFFGIDGVAAFRPIATRDQSWTLGRRAQIYRGADALEVVRFAGAIIRAYRDVQREHPGLPFGGYFDLGVCNDVNAMIEQHMQGTTTLFPLTHDPRYFEGDGEVAQIVRMLPVDGRGDRPDPDRIFGSLPVASLAALPLPALREDLEQVRAAWDRGELEFVDSWGLLEVVAAAVAGTLALSVAVVAFFVLRRRRRTALAA